MTKYCKHLTNIVQYEKRDGCRMCALEKEVSALAKANFKLHEALVIKDHENALKIAEVQKPAYNKQSTPLYTTWHYCPDCGKKLSNEQYCDHK